MIVLTHLGAISVKNFDLRQRFYEYLSEKQCFESIKNVLIFEYLCTNACVCKYIERDIKEKEGSRSVYENRVEDRTLMVTSPE